MSQEPKNTMPTALPVIPLRGITAFPHTIFRMESQMDDCATPALNIALATDGDNHVLLLTQRDMLEDEPQEDGFFDVGVIAEIEKAIKTPGGGRTIFFSCLARARVLHLAVEDDCHIAYVMMREAEEESPLTEPMQEDVYRLARLISDENERRGRDVLRNAYLAAVSCEDVGKTSDCIASALLDDYRHRQTVLECFDPAERIKRLVDVLKDAFAWATCEERIEATVHAGIEENHKEYYLREKMKVIQTELGEEDDDEIAEYQEKLDALTLPDAVREKLEKELNRLAKTPYGAAESTVLRNYLDTCMEIPFGKYAEAPVSVREAAEVLESEHDGLKEVKERILDYIAVRQISPDVGGQILCLVGPPGVGKTSIAFSIARALHRPCARISLGGVRDEADIRGHRKTYVAAQAGRIVDAVTEAGIMNPVLILDEVDKLASGPMGDPASALLEVLDPEQNKTFRDHFTEIPMDLSSCIFIATANYYDGIPAPLLDRMEIIELTSYTENEKCAIAYHHLLPKQIAAHGMDADALRITEPAMRELIRLYTREAGVRELERRIATLCRKVARRRAEGKLSPVILAAGKLQTYLGVCKYLPERTEKEDLIGTVNGLAYTSVGGDVLEVEVLVNDGTGKIELTGSLGAVMKESAQIAVSLVRSLAHGHGIPENFYKDKDLHIHFPEGAVPKDGPSAGVTVTTAIFSALSGLPARHDIAMTGEVTLRGKVLPIGGLKEKSMAAYRVGIGTVLIPRDNLRDLTELDAEVKRHMRFVPCDTIEDVLRAALVGYAQEEAPRKARPAADTRVFV